MTEGNADSVDALLNRARAGERNAFEALVRGHQRMVFSLGLRMLADRHKAEDLAQEVFLQLYRKLGTIQSGAHLTPWLRQVTTRKAIDRLRREPPQEVELAAADDYAAPSHEVDPLLGQRLRALLDRLSPTARAVVVLRYQEDLDPMEIARSLDMSINTVKSHLKRSLDFLRQRATAMDSKTATPRLYAVTDKRDST